ncbi:MAG: hypothetical protein RIB71_15780 [Imperialibacter sp.]|uniref:hypothetical protein n=1 Tax=Imperialibacter sp. TaxID=2038411 RepID=UPI0032ECBA91
MSDEIKSGKEVIDEFFAEIPNVEGVDQKTVDILVELYGQGKLTDRNIQNALEELKQAELNPRKKQGNGED